MTSPRVLIFGGSFNPPTLAHEAIITACLALPQFDEVRVMPSGSRADKQITVSDEARLEMLHMVHKQTFASNPRLRISDFELQLPRPTRLHRTVSELVKKYPDTEFWFAFGGDAYKAMDSWYNANEFIQNLRIVVFTEHDVPEAATGRALHLNIPSPFREMSSSEVRAAIARGADASAWVSQPVLRYIAAHHLYQ
ncbi:MAG TPA: nicotinate-nicotinamide nucleotide adenylyltransferase [Patescibacteria group bacterium]|nr:nicotinate-nicotinamide nucleotide adenylyltransferase [Patescibacteria group bacterium]